MTLVIGDKIVGGLAMSGKIVEGLAAGNTILYRRSGTTPPQTQAPTLSLDGLSESGEVLIGNVDQSVTFNGGVPGTNVVIYLSFDTNSRPWTMALVDENGEFGRAELLPDGTLVLSEDMQADTVDLVNNYADFGLTGYSLPPSGGLTVQIVSGNPTILLASVIDDS